MCELIVIYSVYLNLHLPNWFIILLTYCFKYWVLRIRMFIGEGFMIFVSSFYYKIIKLYLRNLDLSQESY